MQNNAFEELTLYDDQQGHYDRVVNILNANFFYIDTSEMGSGKTYVAVAVAKYFGFKILTICPATLCEQSNDIPFAYGVETFNAYSYQEIGGRRGCSLSHTLLTRRDYQVNGKDKVEFEPTPQLLHLINQGVLFVFDEVQSIKNLGIQHRACGTICRAIMSPEGNSKSRFCYLSATPIDKEPQVENMCRNLGIITSDELYTNVMGDITLTGLDDMATYCERINEAKSNEILQKWRRMITPANAKKCVFELYTTIAKQEFLSDMPAPRIGFKKDAKNGYYKMSAGAEQEFSAAIHGLASCLKYDEGSGTVEEGGFGTISNWIGAIEKAKMEIFIRKAKEDLVNIPKCKVVLAVQRQESIAALYEALKEYEPLCLYGDVKMKERGPIINAFQKVPDKHRLLIVSIKVGSIGLSMHDTIGNAPRRMYIVPNYSLMDSHQASGRVYRVGLKSDAFVRFVYGKIASKEMSIMNAYLKKTNTAKAVLGDNVASTVLFPGAYESEVEE